MSDSKWHGQLAMREESRAGSRSPYWLGPFQNYNTNCPYLVGDYDTVSTLIAGYIESGYSTFILGHSTYSRGARAHQRRIRQGHSEEGGGGTRMNPRLHDLVARQADSRPERAAIVCGRETLTYGALETAANRLANFLRDQGCRKGDRICLFTPKSSYAIVGMLGALKAGAAYVPIDISSPAPRVARILDACEPRCALVQRPAAKLLDELLAHRSASAAPLVVALERQSVSGEHFQSAFDLRDLDQAPSTPAPADTTEDDTAHILFTSGSTGTPKGVMIAHRNVTSFLRWACSYFGISHEDRISGHSPLHFDLSTFDIYGTLMSGAALYLVTPELNLIAARLAAFIRASQLTQWFSVPSILTYMMQFDVVKPNDFPHLKRLLWCGEAMPTPTLMHWMRRLPHVQFTNLYGPTEATIASSYYSVGAVPSSERAPVPIGQACGEEELLLLDDDLRSVPAGEVGDLYIAGAGLSPGYWRDPEKTAAVFMTHPTPPGQRIYRTGDLARVDENGLFHFLGRKDSQIKSRGYRIELGEIRNRAQRACLYRRVCSHRSGQRRIRGNVDLLRLHVSVRLRGVARGHPPRSGKSTPELHAAGPLEIVRAAPGKMPTAKSTSEPFVRRSDMTSQARRQLNHP